MLDPKFAGKPIPDIEKMPETPNRVAHHRRAHSDTFFHLPDDILLDDFDLSTLDLPSLNIDSSDGPDKPKRSRPLGPTSSSGSSHFRSLSVDSDFFDGLGIAGGGGNPEVGQQRYHHRHSNSVDGSTATSFDSEIHMMMEMDSDKKLDGPDKLAQLSLIDPKRAKRVLANRQSAARSKERKVRYTSELERKVQTLQSEATTLSAQVTVLQRDATGMTMENKELKMRLEALEQQAHLRDALTEKLREEVQRLKIETGQVHPANGNSFNQALPPHFASNQLTYHHFGNQLGQQAQQQQIHRPQSNSNYNQSRGGQPQPSFSDLNHRV